MMTIQKLLEVGLNELSGLEEGPLEARLLLEYVLECDYHYILLHSDNVIEDEKISQYEECLSLRKTEKPISQIMGEQAFYGLTLRVSEDTLIPRQETEILVEFVLENIANNKTLVCDLGTGTGCIPIAICHEHKDVTAIALDISPKALKVAKYNVSAYEMEERINCVESDLFSGLDSNYEGKIDILISNPPYIPSNVIETLDVQVRTFEPRLALDGGEDGLDYYRNISKEAIRFLSDGGMIVYEVGHDQSESVARILESYGYENIGVIQDLSGVNRIVYARMSKPEKV